MSVEEKSWWLKYCSVLFQGTHERKTALKIRLVCRYLCWHWAAFPAYYLHLSLFTKMM